MSSRIDAVRQAARAAGADAALLTHPPHLRWCVGFTGSNGALVVGPAGAHFLTDGRYDAQARAEVVGADVHVPGYRLFEHIAEKGLLGASRLLAVASDHTSVAAYDRLRVLLTSVTVLPADGLLDAERAVKTDEEIERLRAAQSLTAEVFEAIVPRIQAGARESDVAAEIVYQHLLRGAERMAFEPIVASGPRGALPHAHATSREMRSGELVVLDIGGVLDGYASDLTRTVAVGEPGDEARGVYEIVRTAQAAGKAALTPGVSGKEVDSAARSSIAAAGYGALFTHSLGHGLGLEAHEWPRLSQQAEDIVPERAVVTIEPGVYLPDRFGVRIEDAVVVRVGGAETLTPLPNELLVL